MPPKKRQVTPHPHKFRSYTPPSSPLPPFPPPTKKIQSPSVKISQPPPTKGVTSPIIPVTPPPEEVEEEEEQEQVEEEEEEEQEQVEEEEEEEEGEEERIEYTGLETPKTGPIVIDRPEYTRIVGRGSIGEIIVFDEIISKQVALNKVEIERHKFINPIFALTKARYQVLANRIRGFVMMRSRWEKSESRNDVMINKLRNEKKQIMKEYEDVTKIWKGTSIKSKFIEETLLYDPLYADELMSAVRVVSVLLKSIWNEIPFEGEIQTNEEYINMLDRNLN